MVVDELITRLGFQVDPRGMNQANASLQSFMSKAKWAAAAIGAAFAGIGIFAIKSASDIESLDAEFTVMLGSAEKAMEFTRGIREFAAATPFQTMDIANNARLLLSFGIAADEVMPKIRMLGDISGKDALKFNSLTLAFAQMSSTGRLMGQDLLQMVNAGFNPLQVISEKTGRSMGDLKKDMEKGKISVDMINEAFKSATSEGGRFYRNMDTQSKTFGGLVSTLRDNVTLTAGTVGAALLPAMKRVVTGLISLTEGALKSVGESVAGMAKPVLQMLLMIGKIGKVFVDQIIGQFIPAAGDATGYLTVLAASFADYLNKNTETLKGMINYVIFVIKLIGRLFYWAAQGALVLWKATMLLTPSFKWLGKNLESIQTALMMIFGAGLAVKIYGIVTAFQALAAAQAMGATATLSNAGAMGTLVASYTAAKGALIGLVTWTKLNILSQNFAAKAYTAQLFPLAALKAAMLSAAGATKALIASTPPLLAVAAAAASVAWALSRIKKTLDEIRSQEDREFRQSLTDMEVKAIQQKAKALKDAEYELWMLERGGWGAGKQADAVRQRIADYKRYLEKMRALRNDAAKGEKEGAEGMDFGDFRAHLDLATKQATIDMQRMTTQNSKTANIQNNVDLTINAPADPDGTTRLTPRGLGQAAEEAARSIFSLELQKLIVRAV